MAKKNSGENFKNMKMDELKKALHDLDEKIRVLRFKAMGSKSKNVKEEASFKKQKARIMTEMNSKK